MAQDDPNYARTESDPEGKRTEEIKTHVTEAFYDRFTTLATLAGMSKSEYARIILEEKVDGAFHAVSKHHKRGS